MTDALVPVHRPEVEPLSTGQQTHCVKLKARGPNARKIKVPSFPSTRFSFDVLSKPARASWTWPRGPAGGATTSTSYTQSCQSSNPLRS